MQYRSPSGCTMRGRPWTAAPDKSPHLVADLPRSLKQHRPGRWHGRPGPIGERGRARHIVAAGRVRLEVPLGHGPTLYTDPTAFMRLSASRSNAPPDNLRGQVMKTSGQEPGGHLCEVNQIFRGCQLQQPHGADDLAAPLQCRSSSLEFCINQQGVKRRDPRRGRSPAPRRDQAAGSAGSMAGAFQTLSQSGRDLIKLGQHLGSTGMAQLDL